MHVLIIGKEEEERKKIEEFIRKESHGTQVISLAGSEHIFDMIKAGRGKRLKIRTFGEFTVFEGDRPVEFRYSKSLELFALLVDRRGRSVDNETIRKYLWQESDGETDHSSYISALKNDVIQTLSELDESRVLRQDGQGIAVVPENVDCDFYSWTSGNDEGLVFEGRYMEQYSWAEPTAGLLYSIAAYRSKTSR